MFDKKYSVHNYFDWPKMGCDKIKMWQVVIQQIFIKFSHEFAQTRTTLHFKSDQSLSDPPNLQVKTI